MNYYDCIRQDVRVFKGKVRLLGILSIILFFFVIGFLVYACTVSFHVKALEYRVLQLEADNASLRMDTDFLFGRLMDHERAMRGYGVQTGDVQGVSSGFLRFSIPYDPESDIITEYDDVLLQPSVQDNVVTDAVFDGTLWCDPGIDSRYYDRVVQNYGMVPARLRELFESDGWHVHVTGDELHAEGVSSGVVALTDYDVRMIYISEYDSGAILHEMGHYLDYVCGFVSQDMPATVYAEGLDGFYAMVSDGVLDTDVHNYETTQEFFAECFGLYVGNPDLLYAYCPGVYEYLEQVMDL